MLKQFALILVCVLFSFLSGTSFARASNGATPALDLIEGKGFFVRSTGLTGYKLIKDRDVISIKKDAEKTGHWETDYKVIEGGERSLLLHIDNFVCRIVTYTLTHGREQAENFEIGYIAAKTDDFSEDDAELLAFNNLLLENNRVLIDDRESQNVTFAYNLIRNLSVKLEAQAEEEIYADKKRYNDVPLLTELKANQLLKALGNGNLEVGLQKLKRVVDLCKVQAGE